MAAPPPRFVRCPSCQWGTLADGNFCAYCGRPLRPGGPGGGGPPGPQMGQAPSQGSAGQRGMQAQPGGQPNYYQPSQQSGSYMSSGQGRAPLICPSCGTPNDPWLTHCKHCTRALMTSG